jgi:hypothetical protein
MTPCVSLWFGLARLAAQDAGDISRLQQQLNQLKAEFERTLQAQRAQLETLQRQIDEAQRGRTGLDRGEPPPAVAPAPGVNTPVAAGAGAVVEPAAAAPWTPEKPIRLAGDDRRFLNLSLTGTFAAGGSTANDVGTLQLGAHDPNQRGFTVQGVELTLDGAVDPYFKAQANVIYQLDADGESTFELEEAFLQTTSLPWNLQLKAGQFFTEFGRLNATHPHAWSFVDQPLVNGRFLGSDGLRNPGARLSWLPPTPFYSELFLAAQNSGGETAQSFRSDNGGEPLFGRPLAPGSVHTFGDLLWTPRYAAAFELSETQTLALGASGAFGPNGSGGGQETQIYGLDWYWKWRPARGRRGFPFLAWQTELMLRRYEAAAYAGDPSLPQPAPPLPAENLLDYGAYSQLTYGFAPGWVAGLRGDYVGGHAAAFAPDPDRDPRWRIAPNLTWYPTEYSKVRLQYNYDWREGLGSDHSVWLQWEFLLGAHAAHGF